MNLAECSFYRSGKDVNFSVFSDDICRVHHIKSISLPLGGDVDVYAVEPGPGSHWIVIRQTEDTKHELRWFIRKGRHFVERRDDVPLAVKVQVGERFPQLIPGHRSMVA